MDTQEHTHDKLLTVDLLTVVLPSRMLLPSIVLVIMELRGPHVRHDIVWQTILLLQCTTWAQRPGVQMLLRYHLEEGKVISSTASQCSARCGHGKQRDSRIRLKKGVDC